MGREGWVEWHDVRQDRVRCEIGLGGVVGCVTWLRARQLPISSMQDRAIGHHWNMQDRAVGRGGGWSVALEPMSSCQHAGQA